MDKEKFWTRTHNFLSTEVNRQFFVRGQIEPQIDRTMEGNEQSCYKEDKSVRRFKEIDNTKMSWSGGS